MLLFAYTVEYAVEDRAQSGEPAADELHYIEGGEPGVFEEEGLQLDVRFDGEVLSLDVTALAPVRLRSCFLAFPYDFDKDDMVLLNGYQSWTDSWERPASSSMRGLVHVSDRIVDRFVLDGSGDYHLVDYDDVKGHLHGFTYADLRKGAQHTLVASLDESNGFTLLRTRCDDGMVTLQHECPPSTLQPGQQLRLFSCVVTQGSEQQVYDRWFELTGVQARPVRPLVGYTSWYRHYANIDQQKLQHDIDQTAQMLGQLDAPGFDKLAQIDDGWCKVGDWLEPNQHKFPDGMASLARRASEAGLVPGLWLAPFVCEKDSNVFVQHPDWLLRDESGEPVRAGSHWSGSYALDTLNEEVREYVGRVLLRVTREWGFKLLKLDFLYAACMLAHGGMNHGQLMDDAMGLLRAIAGQNVLLLGCGVPLAPAFGRVDYCRIGCDVGLTWDDNLLMRQLHRERVSTKNSVRNTVAREPLDGRAFANDPDVVFLRHDRDLRLSQSQKLVLLNTDAHCARVLLTSDDMSTWTPQDRELFQAALHMIAKRQG